MILDPCERPTGECEDLRVPGDVIESGESVHAKGVPIAPLFIAPPADIGRSPLAAADLVEAPEFRIPHHILQETVPVEGEIAVFCPVALERRRFRKRPDVPGLCDDHFLLLLHQLPVVRNIGEVAAVGFIDDKRIPFLEDVVVQRMCEFCNKRPGDRHVFFSISPELSVFRSNKGV